MTWALAAVLCIILVECALRLPFAKTMARLNHTARRAMRLPGRKHVSDHWKEKAMLGYAGAMFAGTIRLAALLGLLFGVGWGVILALSRVSATFGDFVTSGQGVMMTLLIATGYLALRKGLRHARLWLSRQASA